jgi:NADPH2:quinone reductase
MQAWRVEAHGEPREVMHLREIPIPTPGPGQVAIRVQAVALNLPDTRLCFGTYAMKPELPFTPGFEAAGIVQAVGADGDPELVGRRAIGVAGPPAGSLADVALVRAGGLYELPSDIDAADAAALLIPFTTGHLALHRRAQLQPGETLLVHAGAGGVGSAAIQLAGIAGARVLATAGGAGEGRAVPQFGRRAGVRLPGDGTRRADRRRARGDRREGRRRGLRLGRWRYLPRVPQDDRQ